ncbi:hypothetical protein F4811DRAFT_117878 [Daldinia bambusicola]|nr:hypothetical protein F4811DRAFT_117878 [Daldinia bambusicola]
MDLFLSLALAITASCEMGSALLITFVPTQSSIEVRLKISPPSYLIFKARLLFTSADFLMCWRINKVVSTGLSQ